MLSIPCGRWACKGVSRRPPLELTVKPVRAGEMIGHRQGCPAVAGGDAREDRLVLRDGQLLGAVQTDQAGVELGSQSKIAWLSAT